MGPTTFKSSLVSYGFNCTKTLKRLRALIIIPLLHVMIQLKFYQYSDLFNFRLAIIVSKNRFLIITTLAMNSKATSRYSDSRNSALGYWKEIVLRETFRVLRYTKLLFFYAMHVTPYSAFGLLP